MSGQLMIALHNVMERGTANAAALVDVLPIRPSSGTRLRGVVVPCDPARKAVPVAPGRYLVRTVLPSGEMIDHEVSVAEGQKQDVLLRGDVTPHEWLGWQRFSPERQMLWDQHRASTAPPTAEIFDTKEWLLAPPVGGVPLGPAQADSRTTAFEIVQHAPQTRCVVVVRRNRRADAVVLPVPWGLHPPSPVQIAVPHDADLPISVAIQDPELGPLLGSLSDGAVPSARKLLRPDEQQEFLQMLADKMQNPFGAAVAGFVLLTTSREEGRPYWHPWIENLAGRFRWIPDGAILCGWLALRKRDREAAVAWFRDAVGRGIPVLTGTLRMLHDGLVALNDETSLVSVGAALSHADVSQPFVTLRFDEESP